MVAFHEEFDAVRATDEFQMLAVAKKIREEGAKYNERIAAAGPKIDKSFTQSQIDMYHMQVRRFG